MKKVLGWIAAGVGAIGIVACLLGAGGALVIRSDLVATATELGETAQEGLARGVEVSGDVSAGLDRLSTRLTDLSAKADELAANVDVPSPSETALGGLITDFVSGPYAEVREAYFGLRERVAAVDQVLRGVDRVVDAIELSGDLSERLQEVDSQILALDGVVQTVGAVAGSTVTLDQAAATISQAATQGSEILAGASVRMDALQSKLEDLSARATAATDRAESTISGLVYGVTILLVYLAFLHVLLLRAGLRWAREEPAG